MPEQTNEISEGALLEGAEDGPGKGKKGLVRLLMTVVPLVLLPAAGGAYLAYSQFPMLAETAASIGIDFGLVEEVEKDAPIEYGQFTTLNDVMLNPADSGGKRFLVVSLGLETQTADVIDELKQKDIVVRDAVLRLLSGYTAEELSSIELRSRLKDEILAELNQVLQKGEIDRLYFTQYLLQ
ncbi:MAG: flagellar basal body-associated FliL family protein [Rhodothermales bacterium]